MVEPSQHQHWILGAACPVEPAAHSHEPALNANQFIPHWHILPVQHATGTKGDNANSHWSPISALLFTDYWGGMSPQAVPLRRPNVRSDLGQGNKNILCRVFLIYAWAQLISNVLNMKEAEGTLPLRWHESSFYTELCMSIVRCHCLLSPEMASSE